MSKSLPSPDTRTARVIRRATSTACLLVAAGATGAPALGQQYSFRDLDSNGLTFVQVRDVANDYAVGFGTAPGSNQPEHAMAWRLSDGGRIDISGGIRSDATGVDNAGHVSGLAWIRSINVPDAGYWSAPSAQAGPQNFAGNLGFSQGNAVQGNRMVGWGHRLQAPDPINDSAFVWDTTTQARRQLPNPDGAAVGYGANIDGRWVVGSASTPASGNMGAAAWDISDLSSPRPVNLHPAGFDYSAAGGVRGDLAVGLARQPGGTNHAYLWNLTSGQARDLHAMLPASMNATGSSASDVFGDLVVGQAANAAGQLFAVVWNLVTNTAVDLREFLPAGTTFSAASAVNEKGQVVGDYWSSSTDRDVFVLTPAWLPGDADYNGQINFDDYVRLDNGFNNGLTGWSNGDFNSDGEVNFDDYVLIDQSYNQQGSGRGPGSSVPEPTGAATVGALLTLGLAARRRRR